MPDLPLHDPDAEILEDPTAYDPDTEDDATAPHPYIEGEHLEDQPGVAAVELDEEHQRQLSAARMLTLAANLEQAARLELEGHLG